MEKEQNICEKKCPVCCDHKCCKKMSGGETSGCIYGLAFVGALIYYIQQAETFWMGALGVLKALAWPAFVVYKLLEFLGM